MQGPSLSVVVPAYLKAAVVAHTLRRLEASLCQAQVPHEIIVVVDGSPDGTEHSVRESGVASLRIVSYAVNRGKGYALRAGARVAEAPLTAFADADPDIDPANLLGLLTELLRSGADGVVGSKVHPDSQVSYPIGRRVQSAAYRRLNQALFGLRVSDTQTGLKLFRSSALQSVLDYSVVDGFAFDLELLVLLQAHGYNVVEGPINLNHQFSSTVPIHAGLKVLRDTVKVARRRHLNRRL